MGRIRDAVVTGARAAARIPIPSALTHQALREARSPQPPSHVLKSHAIEQEMIGRTRTVWLDRHHRGNGLIIHLHGGAYVLGSGAQPFYEGSNLAATGDVVVVTLNYRLGVLGFADLSSIDPRFESNAGLSDVLTALRWVRDHIAAFGGDVSHLVPPAVDARLVAKRREAERGEGGTP